jgi:hypothetical protein
VLASAFARVRWLTGVAIEEKAGRQNVVRSVCKQCNRPRSLPAYAAPPTPCYLYSLSAEPQWCTWGLLRGRPRYCQPGSNTASGSNLARQQEAAHLQI